MRHSIAVIAMLLGVAMYSGTSPITILGQGAQDVVHVDAASADGASVWFVELSSLPTADGTREAGLQSEEAASTLPLPKPEVRPLSCG